MIVISVRKTEYLNGNMNLPIFEQTTDHYTAKGIVRLLLDTDLPHSKIATIQPTGVQDNHVFIVDISKLDNPEDVRADDLGSWVCNGKRRLQCAVNDQECVVDIFSKYQPKKQHLFTLVKLYYKHSTAGDYRRTIAEIYGKPYSNFAKTPEPGDWEWCH